MDKRRRCNICNDMFGQDTPIGRSGGGRGESVGNYARPHATVAYHAGHGHYCIVSDQAHITNC
ncbi:BQ5605_C003g01847 [Microbotryum silenes-dioicae]|uniref:BQ5605_C003g01847 protein n=1 Tax=Microbotryum silenes-dioicae TaxID=796604 RepID=A0A2X0MLW3_9BASI|nr:BQ5605_C003g01847 [Microbotryum silenes-dioicae]